MKTIMLATGEKEIDNAISNVENYKTIGAVYSRAEIKETCKQLNPDILIIAEKIPAKESLSEIIVDLIKQNPKLRIVFLTGEIDFSKEDRRVFFSVLVYAGVYDIIHEDKITIQKILSILDNPAKKEDVNYLIDRSKSKGEGRFIFVNDEKTEEETKDYYDNLYVVSSIKPGTGKSFISTNIATMIAEYGVKNKCDKKPLVGLIEADFQNLSLGTLLQIEDDRYNLKTALKAVGKIIDKDGNLIRDIEKIEIANKHIKDCFKPFNYCNNMHALVGSQLTLQEFEDLNIIHYIYLIESVVNNFDVIIVDTNSSMTHSTTHPLLKMAKYCYYILNLDFNNVRNNFRYKSFLEDIGISEKVKYILNENITKNMMDNYYIGEEDLLFDASMIEKDFKLESKIPIISKTTFLNGIYNGKPIALDKSKYTLEARYELSKIANKIWPLSNIEQLEIKTNKMNEKDRKNFFSINKNRRK